MSLKRMRENSKESETISEMGQVNSPARKMKKFQPTLTCIMEREFYSQIIFEKKKQITRGRKVLGIFEYKNFIGKKK